MSQFVLCDVCGKVEEVITTSDYKTHPPSTWYTKSAGNGSYVDVCSEACAILYSMRGIAIRIRWHRKGSG